MNSIVLQLQQDLLSDECDLLNALRKAHIIAVKLKLNEFDAWIQKELNGYGTEGETPDYRKVKGTLRALNPYNGWIPVTIKYNDLEDTICIRKMCAPISTLIDLYKSNNAIIINFSGEVMAALHQLFNQYLKMEYVLFIDKSHIKSIIEHVKDTLLQWTLKLEEMGIEGKNLKFTEEEKAFARDIPQTVNNYYGATSVINAPVSQSQIVLGENNNLTFNYTVASEMIPEIKAAVENAELSSEDRNSALELVDEINDKIKNKKKPGIIRAALSSLKNFLISVGAGTVVAIIDSKMKGLL